MSEPADDWADEATTWDDDPAARAYAAAVDDSLASLGGVADGARVVDFGCGTGLLTERMVGSAGRIDAVDASPGMLDVLRRKRHRRGWANVELHRDLGGVAGSVDLVVCSSVCSFLDDYPTMAKQLASLLGPGGRFVQWDWERKADDDAHGLTRVEVAEALSSAGLVDVEVRTAFAVEFEDMTMAPLLGTGRRPG